ncbi:MAG: PQQ-dependent sugar dehydrogenase [Gemmatimonadetes bacterium]|nr:PQQ-dependent sugar dehydrogenase [Gemmatimonadota bacterium]
MAVLPDERVLFIERKGAIQLYTPSTGTIKQVGFIPVNLTYLDGGQAEDGLLGLAIDPAFAANGWLYLFYSKAGAEPKNVLARYTMRGDSGRHVERDRDARGGGAARAVLSPAGRSPSTPRGISSCRPGTIPTRS